MFGQPEAEIITPDPGFIAYKSMIDYMGAKIVPLPHRMEKNFSFDRGMLSMVGLQSFIPLRKNN